MPITEAQQSIEAVDPKAAAVGQIDRLKLACAAAADLCEMLRFQCRDGSPHCPEINAATQRLRAKLVDAGVMKAA